MNGELLLCIVLFILILITGFVPGAAKVMAWVFRPFHLGIAAGAVIGLILAALISGI